jgi:elongation factor Ts
MAMQAMNSTHITAKMVQTLRERTGAGMMECKKALVEAQGDIEVAIEAMRIGGQAKADKKSGRTAAEGLIGIQVSEDGLFGVMMEVNCETDFVARDVHFVAFVEQATQVALKSQVAQLPDLQSLMLPSGETVEIARHALISKLGENIHIRRLDALRLPSASAGGARGVIGHYLHQNRIGVLVALEGGQLSLAKELGMHIAASQPLVISPTDVPEALIAKERDIYAAQARESGKPANIVEKMVEGRVRKFLDEVSLVGQPFVKDPDQSVGALLTAHQAHVKAFIRYQVGEGIEKKADNFVEEVMAQVRGG